MSSLRVAVMLTMRRALRQPSRWMLLALGIAAATAYAGVVLAESTLAGDQAARDALSALSPLDRAVRVSWPGVVTPAVERQARALLRTLGLPTPTEVVLLNPVRLGATLVRPAAISPLSRWIAAGAPGPCQPHRCPMLALGAGVRLPGSLAIPGLSVPVLAGPRLGSAVPLGYVPGSGSGFAGQGGQPPVLISGDPAGLEALPGLSGVYRSHTWFSSLRLGSLHAWQLAAMLSRLQRAQTKLELTGSQFSLSAPFAGLAAARSSAEDVPTELLLSGGGALAAFALFLILAGGTLREDQREERERLRAAGGLTSSLAAFSVTESALVCGVGMLAGGALACGVTALLTNGSGSPLGDVLDHSLLSASGLAGLATGWLVASAGLSLLLVLERPGIADALALAALAALALSLTGGGGRTRTLLIAPLACLAAGVIVARSAGALLRASERLARRASPLRRLALIGLARSPGLPSLAIAFLAVATGLGGFGLAYRAALLRSAQDRAADRVPLDAVVLAGADFRTPLELAPLARWQAVAQGAAFPVRRTEASFAGGEASVTVPALGVPAAALPRLRGWRNSDGPASLRELARRLAPSGPGADPGPALPTGARVLSIRIGARALALTLVADLRAPDGSLRMVPLGAVEGTNVVLRAPIPAGRWWLQALELREPTGLEITSGHQNAENPAAATQGGVTVTFGAVQALDLRGRTVLRAAVGRWRGVGALASLRPAPRGATARFSTSGAVGVLRPLEPIDRKPLPVFVDPATAAVGAAAGNRLALTVDGAPVPARIAAVLKRFPTVPSGAGGFVIADQAALATALDAWMPGQGRPDELWLESSRPAVLPRLAGTFPYSALGFRLRSELEHGLQRAALARAEQGLLLGGAAVLAALAVTGMLASLLGGRERERVADDLAGLGVGPGALRRELRLRALLAAAAGSSLGLAIALGLADLAVAVVRTNVGGGVQPPLVTVLPWPELVLWSAVLFAAPPLIMTIAAETASRRRSAR